MNTGLNEDTDSIPQTGRSYELIRTIGSGGMAQVYEARVHGESGFERKVAIKRILPEFSDEERMRQVFYEEAKLSSRLHHGNIVHILDWGLIDDCEFIAMEYVDGMDAAAAERRGRRKGTPMPPEVALHIISELAEALAYLHRFEHEGRRADIIHRDVSPHNILLSWDGAVKLSDFGIALTERRDVKTKTGMVKGKTSYMAPEQARAMPLTPAVDIFALGATLHALASGDSPIASTEDLVRVLSGAPIEFAPDLPEDVRNLVVRCMAMDPEARPSAEEVAEEAGRLSSSRLSRPGKAALRAYLEGVKPESKPRHALDQVMGLCLMPLGGGAYTVDRDRATRTQTQGVATRDSETPEEPHKTGKTELLTDAGSSERSSGHPILEEGPARAVLPEDALHRPRRPWMVAGAVLALLAFVFAADPFGLGKGGAGPGESPTVDDPVEARGSGESRDDAPGVDQTLDDTLPDTLPDTLDDAIGAATGDAEDISPELVPDSVDTRDALEEEHDAPEEVAVTDDERRRQWLERERELREARAREAASRDRVEPRPETIAPRTAVPEIADTNAPPPVQGVGWLRVGGSELFGGRIAIDGVPRGHVPFEAQLSTGTHRVVVEKEGAVVLSTAVRVTPEHTRRSPLRLVR